MIALLRAVNVGGTGKLAMADLRKLCEQCGFANPRTLLQSGNVVFDTKLGPARAKALLESALSARMGRPVLAILRSADDLEAALAAQPFAKADPARVILYLYERPPPASEVKATATPGGERLALSGRELAILYPNGQGQSKLKIPRADQGTGRNLNTIAKLCALARAQP